MLFLEKRSAMRFICSLTVLLCLSLVSYAQEDTTYVEDDFDISDFELAAEPVKAFCNNKVLGQNPSALISIYYDFQSQNTLTADPIYDGLSEEEATIRANHGFGLISNFPLLSRNNILINLGVEYNEHYYDFAGSGYLNPLVRNIKSHPLRRTALLLTVFKPLNDKRFILAQVGSELNGDYNFGYIDYWENFEVDHLRIPAALIYGFKPSDRLMWGVGASRTYLGGSLNYLPVIYYYHTFKNEKWGIESVLPSRLALRYRANQKTVINTGFSVLGASYRLSQFRRYEQNYVDINNQNVTVPSENNIELRRSELRIGMGLNRAISDFIWLNLEVTARLNWQFGVDEGDFFRGFDSDNFYMDNQLSTPVAVRLSLSFVSP